MKPARSSSRLAFALLFVRGLVKAEDFVAFKRDPFEVRPEDFASPRGWQ